VYAGGTKVVGRYLVVFALAGPAGVCRLGITATRKMGGAVVRNRGRRRIRELARVRGAACVGRWSGDFVVNLRRGCNVVGWDVLAEEFERCMRRAKAAPRPPAS
jgi:ribonuclease P protein component